MEGLWSGQVAFKNAKSEWVEQTLLLESNLLHLRKNNSNDENDLSIGLSDVTAKITNNESEQNNVIRIKSLGTGDVLLLGFKGEHELNEFVKAMEKIGVVVENKKSSELSKAEMEAMEKELARKLEEANAELLNNTKSINQSISKSNENKVDNRKEMPKAKATMFSRWSSKKSGNNQPNRPKFASLRSILSTKSNNSEQELSPVNNIVIANEAKTNDIKIAESKPQKVTKATEKTNSDKKVEESSDKVNESKLEEKVKEENKVKEELKVEGEKRKEEEVLSKESQVIPEEVNEVSTSSKEKVVKNDDDHKFVAEEKERDQDKPSDKMEMEGEDEDKVDKNYLEQESTKEEPTLSEIPTEAIVPEQIFSRDSEDKRELDNNDNNEVSSSVKVEEDESIKINDEKEDDKDIIITSEKVLNENWQSDEMDELQAMNEEEKAIVYDSAKELLYKDIVSEQITDKSETKEVEDNNQAQEDLGTIVPNDGQETKIDKSNNIESGDKGQKKEDTLNKSENDDVEETSKELPASSSDVDESAITDKIDEPDLKENEEETTNTGPQQKSGETKLWKVGKLASKMVKKISVDHKPNNRSKVGPNHKGGNILEESIDKSKKVDQKIDKYDMITENAKDEKGKMEDNVQKNAILPKDDCNGGKEEASQSGKIGFMEIEKDVDAQEDFEIGSEKDQGSKMDQSADFEPKDEASTQQSVMTKRRTDKIEGKGEESLVPDSNVYEEMETGEVKEQGRIGVIEEEPKSTCSNGKEQNETPLTHDTNESELAIDCTKIDTLINKEEESNIITEADPMSNLEKPKSTANASKNGLGKGESGQGGSQEKSGQAKIWKVGKFASRMMRKIKTDNNNDNVALNQKGGKIDEKSTDESVESKIDKNDVVSIDVEEEKIELNDEKGNTKDDKTSNEVYVSQMGNNDINERDINNNDEEEFNESNNSQINVLEIEQIIAKLLILSKKTEKETRGSQGKSQIEIKTKAEEKINTKEYTDKTDEDDIEVLRVDFESEQSEHISENVELDLIKEDNKEEEEINEEEVIKDEGESEIAEYKYFFPEKRISLSSSSSSSDIVELGSDHCRARQKRRLTDEINDLVCLDLDIKDIFGKLAQQQLRHADQQGVQSEIDDLVDGHCSLNEVSGESGKVVDDDDGIEVVAEVGEEVGDEKVEVEAAEKMEEVAEAVVAEASQQSLIEDISRLSSIESIDLAASEDEYSQDSIRAKRILKHSHSTASLFDSLNYDSDNSTASKNRPKKIGKPTWIRVASVNSFRKLVKNKKKGPKISLKDKYNNNESVEEEEDKNVVKKKKVVKSVSFRIESDFDEDDDVDNEDNYEEDDNECNESDIKDNNEYDSNKDDDEYENIGDNEKRRSKFVIGSIESDSSLSKDFSSVNLEDENNEELNDNNRDNDNNNDYCYYYNNEEDNEYDVSKRRKNSLMDWRVRVQVEDGTEVCLLQSEDEDQDSNENDEDDNNEDNDDLLNNENNAYCYYDNIEREEIENDEKEEEYHKESYGDWRVRVQIEDEAEVCLLQSDNESNSEIDIDRNNKDNFDINKDDDEFRSNFENEGLNMDPRASVDLGSMTFVAQDNFDIKDDDNEDNNGIAYSNNINDNSKFDDDEFMSNFENEGLNMGPRGSIDLGHMAFVTDEYDDHNEYKEGVGNVDQVDNLLNPSKSQPDTYTTTNVTSTRNSSSRKSSGASKFFLGRRRRARSAESVSINRLEKGNKVGRSKFFVRDFENSEYCYDTEPALLQSVKSEYRSSAISLIGSPVYNSNNNIHSHSNDENADDDDLVEEESFVNLNYDSDEEDVHYCDNDDIYAALEKDGAEDLRKEVFCKESDKEEVTDKEVGDKEENVDKGEIVEKEEVVDQSDKVVAASPEEDDDKPKIYNDKAIISKVTNNKSDFSEDIVTLENSKENSPYEIVVPEISKKVAGSAKSRRFLAEVAENSVILSRSRSLELLESKSMWPQHRRLSLVEDCSKSRRRKSSLRSKLVSKLFRKGSNNEDQREVRHNPLFVDEDERWEEQQEFDILGEEMKETNCARLDRERANRVLRRCDTVTSFSGKDPFSEEILNDQIDSTSSNESSINNDYDSDLLDFSDDSDHETFSQSSMGDVDLTSPGLIAAAQHSDDGLRAHRQQIVSLESDWSMRPSEPSSNSSVPLSSPALLLQRLQKEQSNASSGSGRSSGSRKRIAPPDSPPVLAGWLEVSLEPVGRWRRRYLTIQAGLLLIFPRSESKFATARVRLAHHGLHAAHVETDEYLAFKLTRRAKTTLYLKTDTLADFEVWTQTLTREIRRLVGSETRSGSTSKQTSTDEVDTTGILFKAFQWVGLGVRAGCQEKVVEQ